MTILISPTWWHHLQVWPQTPWWPKLELKIWPHLAQSIDSELIEGFWCPRCLNDYIYLPYMIGLLSGGTTSSLVAKNRTKKLSEPFEELQGLNSEFEPCSFLNGWDNFLVLFLATREVVALFAMFLSCLACCIGHVDTLNIKILPWTSTSKVKIWSENLKQESEAKIWSKNSGGHCVY